MLVLGGEKLSKEYSYFKLGALRYFWDFCERDGSDKPQRNQFCFKLPFELQIPTLLKWSC